MEGSQEGSRQLTNDNARVRPVVAGSSDNARVRPVVAGSSDNARVRPV
jgi:hypothetical protein